MFEFRTDVATLQPAQRLADGRLVAEALITKPGVFEYPDAAYPGGIRRELRPDSEVYSKPTMDSLANMPCTPGHPPLLLNANNAKQFMVGATGDKVTREPIAGEPDHLKTRVMVADGSAIKRMDAGDNAVSCGYTCRIDETAGVDPKYGRYDVVQRDIRGNHLAVAIPAGRAGRLARVRMDAELSAEERATLAKRSFAYPQTQGLPIEDAAHTKAAESRFSQTDFSAHPGAEAGAYHKIIGAMNKFGIDTTDFKKKYGGRFDSVDNHQGGGAMDPEKLKENVRALEAGLKEAETKATAEKTRADSAESSRDIAAGRVDQLEKEIASLRVQIASNTNAVETEALRREKVRADEAEAKVARFDEVRQDEVRSRTALMFQAAGVMGQEFRMDDMSDRQIRCAVVKRLDSTADVSDAIPEGMITGQFVQLLKRNLARARQDANVSEILGTTNDQKRTDSKTQKMQEYRDQWKKPLRELIHGNKGG